ncbi:NADPH-dependent FMN reductase [Actinoplanes sp. TFC3]|uniref:NADPH-dependent FMN reductase n=1 Tax=Actinoplanes sp. TFC3 TaxID=1710355 RepID=UPI000830D765|nr:NAD(P)H-dependent oxidoreductase [Actinoplanes sp. TFC3]
MDKLRVAVVVGSTREGRFGPTIARWVGAGADQHPGFEADHVDLLERATVTKQLGAADAFVVVTPEYNHSYPGPLKSAIDDHGVEWRAKPVAFVSYGGLSGGLRAVEHLRPVFAELHAHTIRETVSFHGGRACFDADGQPLDPGGSAALRRLLDNLAWWGRTLHEARRARPYPA